MSTESRPAATPRPSEGAAGDFAGHTPGPWLYDTGCFYASCQLDADGMTMEPPLAEMLGGRPDDYDANLRLIAAAPALLQRLQKAEAEADALRGERDALAKDAKRYRWLRAKVWANGVLSGYEFQFPTYRDLPAPATVMRGSVAQHLDNAIDRALPTPQPDESAQGGAK